MFDFTRQKFLTRMLYAGLGLFGIALRDSEFHSGWRKGLRMQREDGTFVKATDLSVDSVATVFPEGAIGNALSETVLIRVGEGPAGSVNGLVAYSKVRVHAGCSVTHYRTAARQLMCRCRQSVFDVVRDGAVVEGTADRPLPRLPIEVTSDGYLRATGDYQQG